MICLEDDVALPKELQPAPKLMQDHRTALEQ